MINEEKVRELFNIALCDSKSDDSLCRSSPQAITDGTIYGKRA